MRNEKEDIDFGSLLVRFWEGRITDGELERLRGMLASSEERMREFRELEALKSLLDRCGAERRVDVEAALRDVRRRLKRRRITPWRWACAACVAALLCAAAALWLKWGSVERENLVSLAGSAVKPGESKAVLIMENGRMVSLDNESQKEFFVSEEVVVQSDGKGLSYLFDEKKCDGDSTICYNELVVPRGSEFKIQLSDGTNVWLNSESRLRYPVVFKGEKREVCIEGEGYFEVTKNRQQPFIVQTCRDVTIKVLGTSFNIRNYSDENRIEAVLEEGVIEFVGKDVDVVLDPGYRAVCEEGDSVRVEKVDTELYTSWRRGQYIFVNECVENILERLSRWYDIEVFYRDERAKSVVFSGDVRKYGDISVLLDAMEIAGDVRFEIRGNAIFVSYQE